MVAFVRGARPAASPSPATRLTAPEARVSSRASEVSTGGRPARSSVGATFSNFSTWRDGRTMASSPSTMKGAASMGRTKERRMFMPPS